MTKIAQPTTTLARYAHSPTPRGAARSEGRAGAEASDTEAVEPSFGKASPEACPAANYAVQLGAARLTRKAMKAYRAHRLGGPQALKLEDADEPAPGPLDV